MEWDSIAEGEERRETTMVKESEKQGRVDEEERSECERHMSARSVGRSVRR